MRDTPGPRRRDYRREELFAEWLAEEAHYNKYSANVRGRSFTEYKADREAENKTLDSEGLSEES